MLRIGMLRILFIKLFLLIFFSTVKLLIACLCPSTHPWPYHNGNYCCATNRENNNPQKHGKLCDGSIIELESLCCENNEYYKCTSPPCHFNGATTTTTTISTTTTTTTTKTTVTSVQGICKNRFLHDENCFYQNYFFTFI